MIRRPRTLRGRLTLVFALVTAVLCLLVGVLVDFQYRNALRQALDDGLTTRFSNLERDLATSGDQSVEPTLPDEEAFAQIVDVEGQVVNAARQVLHAGEAAQIAQAKDVLRETRRKLYRILAEDAPESPADEAGESS